MQKNTSNSKIQILQKKLEFMVKRYKIAAFKDIKKRSDTVFKKREVADLLMSNVMRILNRRSEVYSAFYFMKHNKRTIGSLRLTAGMKNHLLLASKNMVGTLNKILIPLLKNHFNELAQKYLQEKLNTSVSKRFIKFASKIETSNDGTKTENQSDHGLPTLRIRHGLQSQNLPNEAASLPDADLKSRNFNVGGRILDPLALSSGAVGQPIHDQIGLHQFTNVTKTQDVDLKKKPNFNTANKKEREGSNDLQEHETGSCAHSLRGLDAYHQINLPNDDTISLASHPHVVHDQESSPEPVSPIIDSRILKSLVGPVTSTADDQTVRKMVKPIQLTKIVSEEIQPEDRKYEGAQRDKKPLISKSSVNKKTEAQPKPGFSTSVSAQPSQVQMPSSGNRKAGKK